MKPLYNLDEDESQGAIAINLLPLVSQSELGRVTDGTNNPSKRYCGAYLCNHSTFKGIVFSFCVQPCLPKCLIRSWTENLPVSSVLFLPLLLDMGQIGLEA